MQWHEEYQRFQAIIPQTPYPASKQRASECIVAITTLEHDIFNLVIRRPMGRDVVQSIVFRQYLIQKQMKEIEKWNLKVLYYAYLSNIEFDRLQQGDNFYFVRRAMESWQTEKNKLEELKRELSDINVWLKN